MFAPIIKEKTPFIDNYFSLLTQSEKKSFPQSIILYGENIFNQYLLALNFAKILNCTDSKDFNCACLNCNWVRDNKHPAVITMSKINFKPNDDTAKTVISVKQTLAIKELLLTGSEYHRVFIICDAEIKVPNQKEKEQISIIKNSGFSLPYEDEATNKFWIPSGITRKVFQEKSANSMLKIIEEPPPKTSFIFLTKDKSDLIETIISRSQCFYVPSEYKEDTDFSIISNELANYPSIDRLEINNLATRILSTAEAQNIVSNELLTKFQQFVKHTILANLSNPSTVSKMIEDIRVLQETQLQIKSYIKPQIALENALYRIYKNWEN